MKIPFPGAIDCDLHPAVPATKALLPYLDEFWREQIVTRYLDRTAFTLTSYPPNSPLTVRPDRKTKAGPPGSDFDMLRAQALDTFGTRFAICNVLHGSVAYFNEDMAAALVRAVNDWTAKELLDRDPRLRASILITPQNPVHAVAEIERGAADRRFVQVLMFVSGDMMLGRRILWPIYEAAERHGLTIGIHAGSLYRYPTTPSGFPSYQVEDYIANGGLFENQLVALLCEGVFQKFPTLKFVFSESGVTWLPTLLWRTSKTWRGTRTETPWIDEEPSAIIRRHVRVTLHPFDMPRDPVKLAKTMAHIGSDDMILFSTDYPHWQFDGDDVLPDGLTDVQIRKILVDNPLDTYPRLRDGAVN